MAGVSVLGKDPRKVEGGREGARRRWGPQRIVRLDQLDPRVAAAVRELIQVDEAVRARAAAHPDATLHEKAAAVIETSATAAPEGHGNDRSAA